MGTPFALVVIYVNWNQGHNYCALCLFKTGARIVLTTVALINAFVRNITVLRHQNISLQDLSFTIFKFYYVTMILSISVFDFRYIASLTFQEQALIQKLGYDITLQQLRNMAISPWSIISAVLLQNMEGIPLKLLLKEVEWLKRQASNLGAYIDWPGNTLNCVLWVKNYLNLLNHSQRSGSVYNCFTCVYVLSKHIWI